MAIWGSGWSSREPWTPTNPSGKRSRPEVEGPVRETRRGTRSVFLSPLLGRPASVDLESEAIPVFFLPPGTTSGLPHLLCSCTESHHSQRLSSERRLPGTPASHERPEDYGRKLFRVGTSTLPVSDERLHPTQNLPDSRLKLSSGQHAIPVGDEGLHPTQNVPDSRLGCRALVP